MSGCGFVGAALEGSIDPPDPNREKPMPEPFELQPHLTGDLVDLRPLRADDFAALFAIASDPLVWEQHPDSDRYKRDVFEKFFRDAMASGGAFLVLDRTEGRVIGSTRFFGHDPDKREIEIGWTFLARSHWGGRYNGEMKRLMLAHAFRFVDSVVFIVGPNNVRSQRAVVRIGGVREGTVECRGQARVLFRIRKGEPSIATGAEPR
jgi:N-acetyltransferase